MIVKTETDSYYQFDDQLTQVKRMSMSHGKRGDFDWQTLLVKPNINVGFPMILTMEAFSQGENRTVRRTSKVVSIRENPEEATAF